MLEISHALIGASLAKLIPNPYLGLPLSLASHFIADLIPHWDLHTRDNHRKKSHLIIFSLADATLGFSLGYLLFAPSVPFWYLIIMIFTAQLPDWLESPYYILDWHFPPFSTIKKLQSKLHHKLDFPWGLISQILAVLLFILLARLL